jgi:hypothetical protein
LKSQVERNRSVPVLLLFGYKVTRTEWLQLGNILLKSGTIPLQKINRTEPLRSHSALTVTLRSVHSATKQKTEPLRSRLPNTEQSGSVPKIRDGTAPFYLAPQPNTTLINLDSTHVSSTAAMWRHGRKTRMFGLWSQGPWNKCTYTCHHKPSGFFSSKQMCVFWGGGGIDYNQCYQV